MEKFYSETPGEKEFRRLFDQRRETLEEFIENTRRLHANGAANPDCPAWLVEDLRKSIEMAEYLLKEDALKRNIGDVN